MQFNKYILFTAAITLGVITLYSFAAFQSNTPMDASKNVLGGDLEICCTSPMTGFYRDGYCATGPSDHGRHVVCAVMTQAFLDYTKAQGNDLCTARPEYQFPGLKAGDKWCLCAVRWKEALEAGVAPKVILEATHAKALTIVSLEDLKAHVLETTN